MSLDCVKVWRLNYFRNMSSGESLLVPLQNSRFDLVIVTFVGDKDMAPDFRVRRLVETAHGDGGRFAGWWIPEKEGTAGLAEAAADFF